MPQKKCIDVACAIIYFKDKILVTQRSETMNLPLKWEFVGENSHIILDHYLNLICKFSFK